MRRLATITKSIGSKFSLRTNCTDWLDAEVLSSGTYVEQTTSHLTIGTVSVTTGTYTEAITGETVASKKSLAATITHPATAGAGVITVRITPTSTGTAFESFDQPINFR